MKKLLSLLLAMALILGITGALAETTLTVWCWDPAFNLYAMEEAAKVYKEINPDVTINIVEVLSADLETRQTAALSANQTDTLPDILLMQDNSGRRFLDTFPGAYFAMDGLVDYDNFASYKIDKFSVDGKRTATNAAGDAPAPGSRVRAVLAPKDPPPAAAAPEAASPASAPALRPSNSLSGGAK